MRTFIVFTLALGLAAAWYFNLRPTALGGPAGYIIVAGQSMEPTYRSGDLVITRKQQHYRQGDIVAFRVEGGSVIHRIVGGDPVAGFETQGDNNSWRDRWRPTTDQLIGKEWLHLPGGGKRLEELRTPQNVSALAGGLAALLLAGGQTARRRKRRTGGHAMSERRSVFGTWSPSLPGPPLALAGLTFCLLIAVLAGLFALRAFTANPSSSRFVERNRLQHTAAFDYSIVGPPSTLYPTGVAGPVRPPEEGAASPAPPIVYSRLARTLDLGFDYAFTSTLPPQLRGELSADVVVRALGDNGWSKTLPLLPPQPFAGPTTRARFQVDLAPVFALIDTVEKETGYSPGRYEIGVQPRVHVSGNAGPDALDETFAPAFKLAYDKTALRPEAELRHAQSRSFGDTVSQPNRLALGPASIDVDTARPLGLALLGLSLVASGVLAAVIFLGLGQGLEAQLRARYGTRIVPVSGATPAAHSVRVASLEDLAALAARDGRVIFRRSQPDGDVYFLPDGNVTYEFASARIAAAPNLER